MKIIYSFAYSLLLLVALIFGILSFQLHHYTPAILYLASIAAAGYFMYKLVRRDRGQGFYYEGLLPFAILIIAMAVKPATKQYSPEELRQQDIAYQAKKQLEDYKSFAAANKWGFTIDQRKQIYFESWDYHHIADSVSTEKYDYRGKNSMILLEKQLAYMKKMVEENNKLIASKWFSGNPAILDSILVEGDGNGWLEDKFKRDQALRAEQEKEAEKNMSMAYIQAKHFVEKVLKAPATADFPWEPDNAYYSNGYYHISGHVDSQNEYSAMLRSDFTCKMSLKDDVWSLEGLTFNGEKIL